MENSKSTSDENAIPSYVIAKELDKRSPQKIEELVDMEDSEVLALLTANCHDGMP